MTIKFLGHACFLIVAADGTRIMIDPYETGAFGNALNYGPISDEADVVLVTHDHADHNYVRGVPGSPQVCRSTCVMRDIQFNVTMTYHDDAHGSKRGENAVFSFEVDGVRLCHVGDLGQPLTADHAASIGAVDVLMAPVGGTFTINAEQAWQVVETLAPRVMIPMHFKTAKTNLPIETLDGFISGRRHVERPGKSEIELAPETLGEGLRVVVLEPAN